MGSCFSKKGAPSSSSALVSVGNPTDKFKADARLDKTKQEGGGVSVKKEVFIIKHRRSHEVERQRAASEEKDEEVAEKTKLATSGIIFSGALASGGGGDALRTSNCTKEEVDAILIHCGRLSRSSSAKKPAGLESENTGKKYSGSKRSYDFDNEKSEGSAAAGEGDDGVARERENRRRERPNSQGRRRTPSREREKDYSVQNRSGSRERGGGGGRRVSRSPGRRSQSPIPTSSGGANPNSRSSKPEKMVSVPATVSTLAMDKSTSGGGCGDGNVRRIQVKRNAVSPRTGSPARVKAANENQPLSLSRNNSKKAEHSPYRRNPLGEIDANIISQAPPTKKPNADRINSGGNQTNMNCKNQEFVSEETKLGGSQMITGCVGLNVIPSGSESLKHQMGIDRSRSSRLSRDLDINNEAQDTDVSSYTALLLEDIQNFHQKSTSHAPEFSLPACVTKARSILEAVADLNSSTGSNFSTTLAEDRRRKPISSEYKPTSAANLKGNMILEMRDPILESEIVADDDLMEPSFHKYVTVRRGTMDVDDLGEQESSGSNSIAGNQQQWVPSSFWEPNSAGSADRLASSSSRACSRQNDASPPLGFQKHTMSAEEGPQRLSSRKKDSDHHQLSVTGIGKGRNVTPVAPASN